MEFPMSTALTTDLRLRLGDDQVADRPLDLARMAHDASHYLLQPRVVVTARDGGDVAEAVRLAARHGVPVTFRSGGTSLSGQAQTDGVLIDTRRGFRGVEVLDAGARVRCQPGATVRAVNAALAPYGRALGPDPASEVACTIGGVVANNSSGMSCGTTANTYRTLAGLVHVRVALFFLVLGRTWFSDYIGVNHGASGDFQSVRIWVSIRVSLRSYRLAKWFNARG